MLHQKVASPLYEVEAISPKGYIISKQRRCPVNIFFCHLFVMKLLF
ncbi:hypothetical protein F3D3_2588 [Fusibacter sp. 3D3]|nr:hypothetical protein F3D3_2588 [Fusibacter sp. 3D3]